MSYSGGHNFDPYAAVDVDTARDEEGSGDPMTVSFHQDYPEHPFGDEGSKANIPQSDSPLGQPAGFEQQQQQQQHSEQQQHSPFDQIDQIDQSPQHQHHAMEHEPAYGQSGPKGGLDLHSQNQNQNLFGGAPDTDAYGWQSVPPGFHGNDEGIEGERLGPDADADPNAYGGPHETQAVPDAAGAPAGHPLNGAGQQQQQSPAAPAAHAFGIEQHSSAATGSLQHTRSLLESLVSSL